MSKGHTGSHLKGGKSQGDRNERRLRILENALASKRLTPPRIPTVKEEREREREREEKWLGMQSNRVSMKKLKANPFPPPSFTTLCKEGDVFTVQGGGDEFTEEDTRLRFRKDGVFYDYAHSDIGQLPLEAIRVGSDALERRGIKGKRGSKVIKLEIEREGPSSHQIVEVTIRPIHTHSQPYFIENID